MLFFFQLGTTAMLLLQRNTVHQIHYINYFPMKFPTIGINLDSLKLIIIILINLLPLLSTIMNSTKINSSSTTIIWTITIIIIIILHHIPLPITPYPHLRRPHQQHHHQQQQQQRRQRH